MTSNIGVALLTIVIVVIAIAVLWWILSKLYQRSTTELSFVRTGFLGERVAISGGALVIPVLHEVTRVNMNTLRIPVGHAGADALITQDRLRVDVHADFYVRVNPTPAAVAAAARTLGTRTSSVDSMAQLFVARFSDALRTAAAEQTMEALHENRSAFARRVREMASLGLESSGLEIDSVSISTLDQTSRDFFNPNNAFDAAGLTRLTAEIEERRRKRNEIERDSQVAIQRKNLAAEQQLLELQREEEYARLAQEREIAVRRAQQQSQIAAESADMKRGSRVAEVGAEEAVERARMASERTLREEKIRIEQQIRQAEIDRTRAIEIAETERRKVLELAQQATEIEIAEHSRRRNEVLALAEQSRALTIRAEEAVISARELERAEREKALALVAAAREVEAKGLEIVQTAVAEKSAAEQRAAIVRLVAGAEAEAAALRRESADRQNDVDARGRRAMNEAENVMSADAMQLRARLAAIDRIEAVVRESTRPLERISDIKIVHVDGLGGSGPMAAAGDGGGGTGSGMPGGSLSDQIVSSALKYKLQAPLVDALLESAGIRPDDTTGMLKPQP